jgi:hypothetical protein
MAKVYIMDFDGATAEQYEAVIADMGLADEMPAGGVFHYAGPTDTGWRVVDCWADAASFDRFAADQIMPLAAKHGLPRPALQMLDVAQERHGALRDATFLQVVVLPGLDRMGFLDMDKRILPDGRPPQDVVHHVNGVHDGGSFVVDSWTSKEAHDRFDAERIHPNIGQAKLSGPPRIEHLVVHNAMHAPAVVRT